MNGLSLDLAEMPSIIGNAERLAVGMPRQISLACLCAKISEFDVPLD